MAPVSANLSGTVADRAMPTTYGAFPSLAGVVT